MKIYKVNTDNVFFTGDLHGEFDSICGSLNAYDLNDCILIFCGDIGIGFEKEEYYNQKFNHISKKLAKRNVHLYMFRGNHDNKDYFDGQHFTQFEFIHIIPDYSIIQTPTRNILCVGGAISIDRIWRKQNMDQFAASYFQYHECTWDEAYKNSKQLYWENEPIVFDEVELSTIEEAGIKIDTVCTHTAPTFCEPLTKIGIQSWLEFDEELEDDLDNERKVCDNIFQWLRDKEHPITKWYYGHFHFHHSTVQNDVQFTLLDMTRTKLDII